MEYVHDRNQCPAVKTQDYNRLIEDFAARTANAATSDRAAAERLRWEILDHLAEAATSSGQICEESAKRAIEKFGSTEYFAYEYRTTIVETRMHNMRSTAVYALIVVFAGMRLRNVFLAPGWREDLSLTACGEFLLFVDRYAFLIAVLLMSIGWLAKSNLLPSRQTRGLLLKAVPKGDLITIAAPSILLLLSGLAIIGSIFVISGTAVMSTTQYGVGSLTFATLVLVCIIISTQLAHLAGAYAWIIRSIAPHNRA